MPGWYPCRQPLYSRLAGAALSGFLRTLPIPAPINRGRRHHGQPGEAHGLAPVVHPAAVFAPCGLLGVADKVDTRNVVVVANLGPAEAGEEGFGVVRVGANAGRILVLVVDPLNLEPAMKIVPGIGFVRWTAPSVLNTAGRVRPRSYQLRFRNLGWRASGWRTFSPEA